MEKDGRVRIKSEYIPGVCNIGTTERQVRRKGGWIGLIMSIVLWLIFVFTHTPQIWRLFIFLPAGMAATGFLQSAFHFCAGFGMKGVFNFGTDVGKTDTVIQAEFRQKDRQKALLILFLSVLFGVLAAVASFLLKL